MLGAADLYEVQPSPLQQRLLQCKCHNCEAIPACHGRHEPQSLSMADMLMQVSASEVTQKQLEPSVLGQRGGISAPALPPLLLTGQNNPPTFRGCLQVLGLDADRSPEALRKAMPQRSHTCLVLAVDLLSCIGCRC